MAMLLVVQLCVCHMKRSIFVGSKRFLGISDALRIR